MNKEVEMPAQCEECENIFNLNDDLIGEDWNKTIPQVLFEKYGNDSLLCVGCRKILRIVEEGRFRFVFREDGEKKVVELELISEEGERKLLKLSGIEENFVTFKFFDRDISI